MRKGEFCGEGSFSSFSYVHAAGDEKVFFMGDMVNLRVSKIITSAQNCLDTIPL